MVRLLYFLGGEKARGGQRGEEDRQAAISLPLAEKSHENIPESASPPEATVVEMRRADSTAPRRNADKAAGML